MRASFLAICLGLYGLPALAQFTDSTRHHLRLQASGNLNRAKNITSYLFANEGRFSLRSRKTTLNTIAAWVYGELGSTLTNNDLITTVDFNIYPDTAGLYYWGLANYTTSYSLRIRNQLQSGVGVAYNFFNKPDAWLNLSEGILYETSSLITGNNYFDTYQTVRNSLRLSYKFLVKETISFSGMHFLQNAFNNRNDYIIRSVSNFGVKINKWITLGTMVTYNQLKRTGAQNLLFTYGLTAERYF